jgi:hypothetical protein
MAKFQKHNLPDPISYYESEGLKLDGYTVWRTTKCEFHGGRTTMRINTSNGAFICMAGCGARGGNVLDYHMAAHGMNFKDAAKALGALEDDGQPFTGRYRSSRISAHDLLRVVQIELYVCALVLSDAVHNKMKEADLQRFIDAASFIIYVAEVYSA